MCSCCVTCSACKQGRLVFPVACLARYLSSTRCEAQKEETRPVCFCSYVLSYMCFCMLTCVFGEWGGCLGLRREGGSATALTDFQAPRHDRKTPAPPPPPPPLTPAEADARFNTASTKQTQTPTVPLYVARSGCARRLVENPCLYRNHNTVDLQREAPAHARATQNITDHLLNTEN